MIVLTISARHTALQQAKAISVPRAHGRKMKKGAILFFASSPYRLPSIAIHMPLLHRLPLLFDRFGVNLRSFRAVETRFDFPQLLAKLVDQQPLFEGKRIVMCKG